MSGSVKDAADDILSYLQSIGDKPICVQLGLGSGAGVLTGYMFGKSSRVLAGTLGCSLIIFQFFNHRGYITVNRTQLERDLRELKNNVKRNLGLKSSAIPSGKEVDKFLTSNAYLLGGYAAGCLLGYAFS